MPLLAADVIGDGDNCGNRCGGNGGSGNDGALRYFSGVMFKILHIKSNILNIKLTRRGGVAERNSGSGCGDDDNNGGGGGSHSEGGGHRQQSTQSGSGRNGSNQLKAAVKETVMALMAMVSVTASATATAGGEGNGDGKGKGQRFAAAAPVAMASTSTVARAGAGIGGRSGDSARADINQPKRGRKDV